MLRSTILSSCLVIALWFFFLAFFGCSSYSLLPDAIAISLMLFLTVSIKAEGIAMVTGSKLLTAVAKKH